MATVPLSGTNIRLLSGVPFSNDYKHTRWFDSLDAQTNYFISKTPVHMIDHANFQRLGATTFIAINASIEQLLSVNYLMFQNYTYSSKWFYAFVTKVEYAQKNVTYIHFEIDVFQTWKFNYTFKPSFVVREHCKLWNSDGTPVINTVDEGLNYGTEYETVEVNNYVPYDQTFFLVIVSKSIMHFSTDPLNTIVPNINALPQPLTYYVHPFRLDGTVPNAKISGTDLALSGVNEVLKAVYSDTTSVNNVVALYVTEYFGENIDWNGSYNGALNFDGNHFTEVSIGTGSATTIHVNDISAYIPRSAEICGKYSGYNPVTESKLLMHPYAITIMDDLKGNRKVIKNEYIKGNDIVVIVAGSLGTANKIAYYLDSYLIPDNMMYWSQASLENGLINNSPNDIPIVSDYLSAYLQGNKNTIENQKSSIMWNAGTGMIGNAIGGIASASSGNAIGVASSALGIVQGAGQGVIQIQAIEAKLKDIDNTPPNLVKMGGNAQFDYGNGIQGVFIIKKQITKEYRDKLTDFFNLYGYKVNEVKIPNFHTRRYWNYVQTKECNIIGKFNNEDLRELKSIFDNGITLWHTDDVGNYDLANGVI